MRERRKAKRFGRRLTVRWGESAFEHAGFTQDVSSSGMFVVSRTLPDVGERVHLQVQVTATQVVHFEGRVQRHKQAPRALQSVAPSGFGVSFVPLEELVEDILPRLRAAPLELSCATVEDARRLVDDQLRRGGLFVATQATPARDESLTVVIKLLFADAEVVLDGRVMQVMPGAGVALQLERAAEAVASVEGMLG
ncbi:MAG: hypothetical protein RL653_2531 [Pseudomonadota bacterium]|jgi:Tfp pilus assembly protein PilZ